MSLQVGGFYHEEQFTKNFIFTAMRCDAVFSSTHDDAAEEETDIYITELKVNHLVEPIGIDIVPNFRWINNMSGYIADEVAATDHTWNSGVVTVEPTQMQTEQRNSPARYAVKPRPKR